MQISNPTLRIPLDLLRANAHVTEVTRPTVAQIMALREATEPPLTRGMAIDTLRAIDAKRRLQEAGLKAICKCAIPTRTGMPETTIATSDADVFVAAVNESNVQVVP